MSEGFRMSGMSTTKNGIFKEHPSNEQKEFKHHVDGSSYKEKSIVKVDATETTFQSYFRGSLYNSTLILNPNLLASLSARPRI